jgi:hypothetical protein
VPALPRQRVCSVSADRLRRREGAVTDHPADLLDQWEFDTIASFAAFQLQHIGFTYCSLSPGDGTKYEFTIVRPPMISHWQRWLQVQHLEPDHPAYQRHPEFNDENRYFVASSLGRMYPWSGHGVDWTYALEKWCLPSHSTAPWTARVTARFLTALARSIANHAEDENGT